MSGLWNWRKKRTTGPLTSASGNRFGPNRRRARLGCGGRQPRRDVSLEQQHHLVSRKGMMVIPADARRARIVEVALTHRVQTSRESGDPAGRSHGPHLRVSLLRLAFTATARARLPRR